MSTTGGVAADFESAGFEAGAIGARAFGVDDRRAVGNFGTVDVGPAGLGAADLGEAARAAAGLGAADLGAAARGAAAFAAGAFGADAFGADAFDAGAFDAGDCRAVDFGAGGFGTVDVGLAGFGTAGLGAGAREAAAVFGVAGDSGAEGFGAAATFLTCFFVLLASDPFARSAPRLVGSPPRTGTLACERRRGPLARRTSAATVSSRGWPEMWPTPGSASSAPRRWGSRAVSTKTLVSLRFRTSRALRGAGSARLASGM